MSGFWKIIIIAGISLILIAIGLLGYRQYRDLKDPTSIAIDAITNDAVIFAEINTPSNTFEKFARDFELIKELSSFSSFDHFQKSILYLDSIVETDQNIESIFQNHKLIVSVNETDSNSYANAYILELPGTGSMSIVESFIKKINGDKSIIMLKQHEDAMIQMVNISQLEKIFKFTVFKGLFMGSFDEELLRKMIDQILTGTPVYSDKNFSRLMKTTGENVDANIYLNHKKIKTYLANILNKSLQSSMKKSGFLAEWTETDLIIKNSELLANGYTILPDTGEFILNAFRQQPQKVTIPDILPHHVSMMIHFGIEDFKGPISTGFELKERANITKEFINSCQKSYSVNINKEFISWIGKEAALVNLGQNQKIAIIQANDIKVAAEALSNLSNKVDKKKNQVIYTEEFGEYMIGRINLPNLLDRTLGPLFSGIQNPYYITIKDYVVFANHPGVLRSLVNDFYNRKTLSENLNYRLFSNNISDRSNIYFYCNIRRSINCLSDVFKPEHFRLLTEDQGLLQNYEGLAIQFSYINEMFYTNIYLKHNPAHEEVNPSNWETELESQVWGQPKFVYNHKTGKQNILATDDLSNLYLLDHLGQIQWKIPLIEKPISSFFEVDYFKNDQTQFLFNTENYLYLIDVEGNYVGNYPVKLIKPATNPLAVFDYEGKQEYRLLLALSDNKIYNYDIHTQTVEGWNKVRAKVSVMDPVEHFVQNDKDYLFIKDKKGNLNITNRRGIDRIKVKKNFTMGENTKIYINKTNSKGDFITTDTKGHLVYISSSGKINKTKFDNFSLNHYFLYDDFTGNNSIDFIFIDGDNLVVYDRFKNIIIQEQLEEPVKYPPLLFQDSNGSMQLGILCQNNKKVVFYDYRGKINKYNNIEGHTQFTVGKFDKSNDNYLIIGYDNKIKAYSLE